MPEAGGRGVGGIVTIQAKDGCQVALQMEAMADEIGQDNSKKTTGL